MKTTTTVTLSVTLPSKVAIAIPDTDPRVIAQAVEYAVMRGAVRDFLAERDRQKRVLDEEREHELSVLRENGAAIEISGSYIIATDGTVTHPDGSELRAVAANHSRLHGYLGDDADEALGKRTLCVGYSPPTAFAEAVSDAVVMYGSARAAEVASSYSAERRAGAQAAFQSVLDLLYPKQAARRAAEGSHPTDEQPGQAETTAAPKIAGSGVGVESEIERARRLT